jgi:hypothetical protein
MAQTTVPIPLVAHQHKLASEVMDKAFHNDPLWKYLIPDEAKWARAVSLSMNILVRYSLLYGKIYTTPTLDGVACWLPPSEPTPSFSRLVGICIRSAPFQLGWTGFRRYLAIENYCEKVHKSIVPGTHWYLWGLVSCPHDRVWVLAECCCSLYWLWLILIVYPATLKL